MMHAFHHLLRAGLFFGVFLLGRYIVGESRKWADSLAGRFASGSTLDRVFLSCGWVVQIIGVVWSFLDAVAVLVLAT